MSATASMNSLAGRLDPAHTALLVIDMQNDFCAPKGHVEMALRRDASACRAVAGEIMALVAEARAAHVPVIWVRADYAWEKVPPGMRVKAVERGADKLFCAAGTWGAEFYDVAPAPGETIIDKHCYSAFMGTRLDAHLRALGIQTLVFAGVQTNVCVESTLRDGQSLGFHVVVAADCVASHTQAAHDTTLQTIGFLFGDVVPRRDISRHWGGR